MELPFMVVFEPPSQAELRAVLRLRRTWLAGVLALLAVGTGSIVGLHTARTDAAASSPPVPFEVSSRPSGAAVWLDGREVGRTPLAALVQPGQHAVLLKASAADALEGQYRLDVGAQPAGLQAILWRRRPLLTRLRPALPGAVLSNVGLLGNGQLALSIALPPGPELQAWRFDPLSGAVYPVVPDAAGTRLTLAADGRRAALVGYDVGPPEAGPAVPAKVLWLTGDADAGPAIGWRPPLADGEELLDASWSPSGDRLLVVAGQALSGGAIRSRVWFVDADGRSGSPVLSLPSRVEPGSELWSPDGQHVAFLAQAGQINALCLVDLDGRFRYVADLVPLADQALTFPPAAWSADSQRLLFVAPHQHPPGVAFGWWQTDVGRALYVASAADPTPVLVADTDVDLATWREDGQLLGLGRLGADGALDVRLLGEAGSTRHLVDLALQPAGSYAATWDVTDGRLLVAARNATGGVDYWLALLGLEQGS